MIKKYFALFLFSLYLLTGNAQSFNNPAKSLLTTQLLMIGLK
jgi:hypothetical protein